MAKRKKEKRASYDVVVVGGGLSGMCAAIASARHGAKTALIHARHVLGGNASSEIRMHICGASESMAKPDLEEGGILYEMMLANKCRNDYFSYSTYRKEMLIAAEGICVMAELSAKLADYETDRVTDTCQWLNRYRESWMKNKAIK